MAQDPARNRLAEWADLQGVDLKAKLIFLSLPSDIRETVRGLGSLNSARVRRPSALLMARIRSVHPDHVELDLQAQQVQASNGFPFVPGKPSVWLVVRGESNPVGSGNEHSTAGSSDTFQANMVAYLRHVVQPLEAQGFQVVVCGDLSTVVEVEDELLVEASFRTVFGRRVQHFGVQAVMIDDRELASITRAWNAHLISFFRSTLKNGEIGERHK